MSESTFDFGFMPNFDLASYLSHRYCCRLLCRTILAEPEDPALAQQRRDDFYRACGDVVCSCGEKYYDHPADPVEPDLHILCDRTRVKL